MLRMPQPAPTDKALTRENEFHTWKQPAEPTPRHGTARHGMGMDIWMDAKEGINGCRSSGVTMDVW